MLQTESLTFAYPGAVPLRFPDINCSVGEQWLLLGQSGSGKTTLLHLLAGLRTPTSGEVRINGTVTSSLSARELDQFRGQQVGVVFQQAHFIKALTILENLSLAQQLAGHPVDVSAIETVLDQLQIGHKRDDRPQQLSVGEQQRAAIARALINKPSLLLADEPTSALDDENTAQVVDLLKRQAAEAGATLLIVTHDNRLKSIFDQQITL